MIWPVWCCAIYCFLTENGCSDIQKTMVKGITGTLIHVFRRKSVAISILTYVTSCIEVIIVMIVICGLIALILVTEFLVLVRFQRC